MITSAVAYTSPRVAAGSMPSSRNRSTATNGSYATTRIPRPSARRATCRPMRPSPSTPSVFPASSIPANRSRAQVPEVKRRVGLRHVPREREKKRDGVLGGRDDRRLRRVRDDDSAPGGGVDVDVVDSHACPTDDLEPIGALDQRRIEFRCRAHDDRVESADDGCEIGVEVLDDVEATPQELESRRSYPLPDENSRPRAFRHARSRRTPRALAPLRPLARCPRHLRPEAPRRQRARS